MNPNDTKQRGVMICASMLLTFFLLTACTQTPQYTVYKVGKEGLSLKFLPNSPPQKVYDNDEFSTYLFVENKGAFDVVKSQDESGNALSNSYAVIALTYDPYYLLLSSEDTGARQDVDQAQRRIYLRGKSVYHPRGEGESFEFGFHANKLEGQREQPQTTILFTLCYPYETRLSKEVCIDKDFYNLDERKKVCTIKDLSFSQGQGAPIVISKIEPRALRISQDTLVEFNIVVENAAGGNVITYDKNKEIADQCISAKPDNDEWNQVNIEAYLLGQKLDCKSGTIKLLENKGEIRCRTSQAVSGEARNFLSVLQVKLDYLYQSSISKNIQIVRSEQ
ncbi:MAG: hypothetical protein V1743_01660 [Nanoarchaeota archaeon]